MRWLTDVDPVSGAPVFDPNLGGFVTAMVTSYQSDFKQKCFSSDDASANKDDDDGDDGYYVGDDDDDDDEGNDDSEE